ncbi:MAG: M24 family metallopeptidase [Phototrophicaceae bacterium]
MTFDYAVRQARLIGVRGVDAIAIVPGANMLYYTGLHFHLSERPTIALFDQNGMAIIVPELEVSKLAARPDLQARVFSWTDTDGFEGAFEQAVRELKLDQATLGVDGQTMRVFEYLAFQQAGSHDMRNVGHDLLRIRALKDAAEVEAMRRAIRLSEQALYRVLSGVRPGMTERHIAGELSRALSEAGSQGEAFAPLIQTGPNSALPHGLPGDRALNPDEFLLIDFGGMMDDYPADITRTFCLGQPSDEMQRIHAAVLAANQAAIAAVRPGVTCGEIDRAARQVIEDAGYGQYFIHRTGHGLGLEGHELPQIAAGVDEPLEAGMVFTVEPGIYVPGLGGVRIEDNVHVVESGVEVLTQFPRDLMPDGIIHTE